MNELFYILIEHMKRNLLVKAAFEVLKSSYFYSSEKKSPEPIRDLFAAILQAKCPVVTHNGLIDLAFMYQVRYVKRNYSFIPVLAHVSW